jgi:trimeric autotransporter adhesin
MLGKIAEKAPRITGIVILLLAVLGLAAVAPRCTGHRIQGETLTVQNLVVNTDGQPVLFSSKSLGLNGNIWIGGGGQSFSGPGMGGTGDNVTVGVGAHEVCTTCFGTIAIGFNALGVDIDGITSTAIGYGALAAATHSVDNTVIGYLAGTNLTTGNTNTSMGVETMSACTTCSDNAIYGMSAGQQLTTGTSNTCVGPSAGCSTSGSDNASLGHNAGANFSTGSFNTAAGERAMSGGAGLETGDANTAMGASALQLNTSGADNVAAGVFALNSNLSGSENVAVGDMALRFNVAGNNGVAVGSFALNASTGGANVGVGYNAGVTITSGVANTVVGYNNSTGITTGNANTIIGSNIGGLAAGLSNAVLVADGNGNFRFQSTGMSIDGRNAPSVNHGALAAGSTNFAGRVTGVGANTSVTITFSGAFANGESCTAQPEGSPQGIYWTPSASAPIVNCFDTTTGAASNCNDFRYTCPGW